MLIEEITSPGDYRAVGVLIYAKDTKKWLFTQRSSLESSPLTWSVPGGGAEMGENPWQTVCRETIEEIGHDISSAPHVKIWSMTTRLPNSTYCMMAAVVPHEFKPTLSWESNDSIWCELSDMPEPKHIGMKALLSNDRAGKALHDFLKQHGAD